MDCSLPGSSICGIFQARVLEWVAIAFSRGSSQPRDRTWVSRIVGRCFTLWATRETPEEYTEELYKKDLHDPDNYYGVVIGINSMWTKNFQMYKLDLEKTEEPEIKLPTFTTARHPGVWSQMGLRKHYYEQISGDDGVPDELFKILEDDAVKVLHSICQ